MLMMLTMLGCGCCGMRQGLVGAGGGSLPVRRALVADVVDG